MKCRKTILFYDSRRFCSIDFTAREKERGNKKKKKKVFSPSVKLVINEII